MSAWGRAAPKICRNPCRYNKHAVRSAGWNDTNTLLDGESFLQAEAPGKLSWNFHIGFVVFAGATHAETGVLVSDQKIGWRHAHSRCDRESLNDRKFKIASGGWNDTRSRCR